jgi:hypothetical protein
MTGMIVPVREGQNRGRALSGPVGSRWTPTRKHVQPKPSAIGGYHRVRVTRRSRPVPPAAPFARTRAERYLSYTRSRLSHVPPILLDVLV